MRKNIPIYALAVLLLAHGLAAAQGYRCDWNSANSGGGATSGGGYTVTCTVGQTSAGFARSTDSLHWIGFWSGGVPTPTLAMRASDVKLLPVGTFVSVVGKVATSIETDFSGFLYIEDEDRKGGIRVAVPTGAVSGLVRGKSIVNVVGTAGVSDNGERQVSAPLVVIISNRTDPLGPVAMSSSALGGVDFGVPPLGQFGVTNGRGLNNVGLLVTIVGRVLEVGAGYLVISDGGSDPVRISTTGLANPPQVDDYVSVTGISSLHPSGGDRLRLVLPRQRSDIWPP